ncbi:MAG: hypothetical protein WC740_11980, partial [Verrucomicrobiia bacterium]
EHEITRLLCAEITHELDVMNKAYAFTLAFSEDLRQAFPSQDFGNEIVRLSHGLIGRIKYHGELEPLTGGDMGIALRRPHVWRKNHRTLSHGLHLQGLLCQAKRQKPSGGFGGLTSRQREVLPERLAYLSILLYTYSDAQRLHLQPLDWLLCEGIELADIEAFLAAGDVYGTMRSTNILIALGNGDIGTDDQHIIDTVICPAVKPYICIEVTWPDDGGPPPPDGGLYSNSLQDLADMFKHAKKLGHPGFNTEHYGQGDSPPKTRTMGGSNC